MNAAIPKLSNDQPLTADTSLADDKLGRRSFTQAAVTSLRRVSQAFGLVLAVEGPWGSGKTSTLAMMESLLAAEPDDEQPVVVHFNPWLIGDREALLKQFLDSIAAAVELKDRAKEGSKVAKELKAYSKVFDLIKLIPGAEPWASIVKMVVSSAGGTVEAISEYKAPDLERQRENVRRELAAFERRIVVFVDDIDRLFPLEVFEMIRIIKAVGDLPNVGYVLAWDPSYVTKALKSVDVPKSSSYLDKIVQIRMALPAMSYSVRRRMIQEGLDSLDTDAHEDHFPRVQERVSSLYFAGMRDLLVQPRDVNRVFNAVALMEPALRGEIVLSDIIGLALLMVKAPAVFELLQSHPRWFVGLLPGESGLLKKGSQVIAEGVKARKKAYSTCWSPDAIQKVVHVLFPLTADSDGETTIGRVLEVEGHIAAPSRLLVALQLRVGDADVSLIDAGRYLERPDERPAIEGKLTTENASDFLESLGRMADASRGRSVTDLEELCVAIARLPEAPLLAQHSKSNRVDSLQSLELVTSFGIEAVVTSANPAAGPAVAEKIISDVRCLTLAASVLSSSFEDDRDDRTANTLADRSRKDPLCEIFGQNVLAVAAEGRLLDVLNPARVLWTISRMCKDVCSGVFAELRRADETLDGFALEFFKHSYESNMGQVYRLPGDLGEVEAFCSLEGLRQHASTRLADPTLKFPGRAAWQSVLTGKSHYGVDGTEARR